MMNVGQVRVEGEVGSRPCVYLYCSPDPIAEALFSPSVACAIVTVAVGVAEVPVKTCTCVQEAEAANEEEWGCPREGRIIS
jgi:hypothetical protein